MDVFTNTWAHELMFLTTVANLQSDETFMGRMGDFEDELEWNSIGTSCSLEWNSIPTSCN